MQLSRSILCLLLVASHAHATSTPAPVVLRLKTDDVGQDYQLKTTTIQTRRFPDGTEKKDQISSRILVHRKVAAVEGGLEIRTVTKEILIALKDLVSKVDPKPDAQVVRVTDRGEPRVEGTPTDPSEHLWPVFPEGEVQVGHSWKTQVPVTAELPFSFEMVHKVLKLEEAGGELVAVIGSSGIVKGKDPRLEIECEGNVHAETTLSAKTGALVKSSSEIHFLLKYPRPTKNGHQAVHKVVTRTLERRP